MFRLRKTPWEKEIERQMLKENARQIQLERTKNANKRVMLQNLSKGNL